MRFFRLTVVTLVVMVLTTVTLGAPPFLSSAVGQADESAGFVGSWRVEVTPAQGPLEVSVGTFHAEGTLTTGIQPVLQAPPDAPSPVVFTSGGHGAWEATGPDTAAVTFLVVTSDAEGNRLGTASVNGNLTLAADGQTFHGEVVRTLTDPEGNTLLGAPATIEGTRITVEAPASAADATPTG